MIVRDVGQARVVGFKPILRPKVILGGGDLADLHAGLLHLLLHAGQRDMRLQDQRSRVRAVCRPLVDAHVPIDLAAYGGGPFVNDAHGRG